MSFLSRTLLRVRLTNDGYSEVQSDDSKGTVQSTADKFGREKDKGVHGGTGDSILDKTKNALGMGKD